MRWVTNRCWARMPIARHGYLAGTDDERLADLNSALRDDTHRCSLVHSGRLWLDPSAGPGGLHRDGPAPERR